MLDNLNTGLLHDERNRIMEPFVPARKVIGVAFAQAIASRRGPSRCPKTGSNYPLHLPACLA